MKQYEIEQKFEESMITKEEAAEKRRNTAVGDKGHVIIRGGEGKKVIEWVERITIAAVYPHFVIDTDGRWWKYSELIAGERCK